MLVPGEEPRRRPKSVREFAAFGMWADREEIPDGVTYVNRLREPRFLPLAIHDGISDRLATALHMDMRQWFTPTADNFLSKISKPHILEAMTGAGNAATALFVGLFGVMGV